MAGNEVTKGGFCSKHTASVYSSAFPSENAIFPGRSCVRGVDMLPRLGQQRISSDILNLGTSENEIDMFSGVKPGRCVVVLAALWRKSASERGDRSQDADPQVREGV